MGSSLYLSIESASRNLTSEYEQLLKRLIDEKKARIAEVSSKPRSEKKVATLLSDVNFLEVELQRYQQSLAIFRTKGVPKVGRWGVPEVKEAAEHKG